MEVSATDEHNLTSRKSVNVYPNTSTFTISANPAGLQLSLDGTTVNTPKVTTGVVNFQRELKAPLNQTATGKNYQFHDWSDDGLIKHLVSTPAVNTAYVANYQEMPAFGGQYFNNMTLTGPATLTRQDKVIDFNWGSGSPGAGIPVNKFSARWTKSQYFPEGNYGFTATADDGVRLYVDGNLIINKWVNQPPTTYTANISLGAGNHEVKMEYFENGGGAVAKLSWNIVETAPVPVAGNYLAEYFNNTTLLGTPAVTLNETEIDFDWGSGSPDLAIGVDNFSARYKKTATFEDGTYDFTATADDGVRVYIDGTLIINKWIDQPATTYTVSKVMTAGSHELKVEYYEKGGGAVLKFNYAKTGAPPPPPPPPPTGVYQGSYWNAGTGSSPAIPTTAANLVRDDAEINFDWDGVSPDPVINADHFIVRWTGTKTFEDSTYRFTTESDDGIRVYVDNQLIQDLWNDHGTTTYAADRAMTAGDHNIKVEYYENGGGAVAKFSFAKIIAPPPAPTTSFLSEFFNNMTLSGTPVLTRNDSIVNFSWSGSPGAGVSNDKFSARFTKDETFEAGTYEFTVTADDGVRLYVDNVLVVDKWIDQPATTYKVSRVMTAGTHNIRIEFYENLWDAVIRFSMAKL